MQMRKCFRNYRKGIVLKKIQKIFLLCAFISLIGVRLNNTFSWVSSLTVAGVFLSIFDIITHIWYDNPKGKIKRNGIYIFWLVSSIVIEVVLIFLMIVNIGSPLSWMQDSLFTDEFTIIALMLGVFQTSIISFINRNIQGKN